MPRAIIMINGPSVSGKSYFAKCLAPLIQSSFANAGNTCRIFRPVDELWKDMVADEVTDGITDYDEFKARPNGRERIIEHSEKKRHGPGGNKHIWDFRLYGNSDFHKTDVVIYDNSGFPREYEFWKERCYFVAILSILFPYGPMSRSREQSYCVSPLEQYPNDSRFRLPPMYGWDANDSEHMLQRTKAVITYARCTHHTRPFYSKPGVDEEIIRQWRHHVLGIPG